VASWEELMIEREETYAFSNANTIPEAVKNIITFLGMQPCDRSDRVPDGKSSHSVALAGLLPFEFELGILLEYTYDVVMFILFVFVGVFRGGVEVLARAKLVLSDGVNLQLTVRSTDELIAELITSSVG